MSLGSKIDTAIDRMFGIASAAQNWNDSLNYTFASLVNVVNASRQKNPANPYRKIFCGGTIDAAELQKIVENLSERLKKADLPADIELLAGQNLLTSSAAMLTLSQCDAAVLFEKTNTARYDQLEDERSKMTHMGKEILGLVLVE